MSEGLTISQLAEKNAELVTGMALLQQKLDAMTAENAKLMSGFSFFMYSDESGFEIYKTEAEAIAAANEMIGCCREDAASDGWPEEAETIRWGVIRQKAAECDYQKASEENGWMGWCDYKLSPEIPATDAIINALRAEGVEILTNKLQALIDGGNFEGNEIAVIAGAIYTGADLAAQLRNGERVAKDGE